MLVGSLLDGYYMAEMTRHVRTTIRYDGPALSGHEMDVHDLAPALIALADIIQIANRKFNGPNAEMRVLVNADVEQKCFMLDLSLVQSLVEQAKGLFSPENVKSAKEIGEWIGLITGITGVSGVSLFQLLRFMRKNREAGTTLQIERPTGTTVALIGSTGTINVTNEIYLLASDPAIVERAKQVIRPLTKPGYTKLSFIDGDREVFEIDEVEAESFIDLEPLSETPTPTESMSKIEGIVRIKSAQYEGNAKWSFMWNGRAIDPEMVDDAAAWVNEFQSNTVYAPPNSVLRVTMTETVKLDEMGAAIGKPSYSVKSVHGVQPPPTQHKLV